MIVTLLTLHLLAVSFWVGSLGALAIATRTAKAVLDRAAQAVYFPRLGRTYGKVGSGDLWLSHHLRVRIRPARGILVPRRAGR